MTTLYTSRPFNLRYAVRQRTARYTPELLRTHRTAQASWLYIHRRHGIDDFGPTPDWSQRDDLVAAGRAAPARANDPALDGVRLWMQADVHAAAIRPDEPACAHAVGSLPMGEDIAGWCNLVTGFCEDHLVSQGMVCDWAIHHRDADGERPAIPPHVHMIVTTRVYDPAHADLGKVRQAWLRTDRARKALAEKWWEHVGIVPPAYAPAA